MFLRVPVYIRFPEHLTCYIILMSPAFGHPHTSNIMSAPLATAPQEMEHELSRMETKKESIHAIEHQQQSHVTSVFAELDRKQTAIKFRRVCQRGDPD